MSIAFELVKSLTPMSVRGPLKRALTSGLYRAKGYSPFNNPLSREVYELESIPRAKSLRELDSFQELQASAWMGLESVAYQMVLREKPKVIVELGTHMGLSALAMGLGLRDLGQGGRLFAIDCWEGDNQAGYYGDSVYQTFLNRVKLLGLDSNVTALKMYFDEAVDKVETPIDILHIDGLHTWEAVNHDFETFGPLVKPGGIIMFHDVNSHFPDVKEFWRGISKKYESHRIYYSYGLGLIRTKS